MNIHEIVLAYTTDTLPTNLNALAPVQNKVDEYLAAAVVNLEKLEVAKHRLAIATYRHQVSLFQEIAEAIAIKVNEAVDLAPSRKQFQL